MRRFTTALLLALAMSAPERARAVDGADVCEENDPLDPYAVLATMRNGWRRLSRSQPGRHGMIDEQANAIAIYEVFRDHGHSAPLAFAAIVNAMAESALDNSARMDQPFTFGELHYPRGTGAVGLFQLLPSRSGAGSPSGPPEGYPREFMGRRWAGTRWQAQHHADTPDWLGRTYYDATDPRVNTARIVLEVERDGARLLAAERRGASIAELAWLFGQEIERPQHSTLYRKKMAVDMYGPSLATARNPGRLFAAEPDPVEVIERLELVTSPAAPEPEPPAPVDTAREPRARLASAPLLPALLAIALSFALGILRRGAR